MSSPIYYPREAFLIRWYNCILFFMMSDIYKILGMNQFVFILFFVNTMNHSKTVDKLTKNIHQKLI